MDTIRAQNIIIQHWNFSDEQVSEAKLTILAQGVMTEPEIQKHLEKTKPPITAEQEKRWKKKRRKETLAFLGLTALVILWLLLRKM